MQISRKTQDVVERLAQEAHAPLRTDQDGVIRVGNTRVTLMTIVGSYRINESPDQIHEGFSTVSLADINAVIAFYLAHQEKVDEYIRQEKAEGERWRQEYEANNPKAAAFNAKIRALLDEKHSKG